MRKDVAILAILLVALTTACRKPKKVVLTRDQRSRIEGSILKEAPTPKYQIGAQFGEGIKLIGIDVSSDQVKPGDQITITWYWECLKPTPGDWKVFGHLELPQGKRMLLDHVPVGELYPISEWKQGEIIKDEQKVVIDSEAKPGIATLWAGIFSEEIYRERGSGDRMPVTNKDKVQHDGDNRVKVLTLTIDGGAQRPISTIKAIRSSSAILIDGKFDEPSWNVSSPAVFTTADGRPVATDARTTVRALYDDTNIYFGFQVADNYVESQYKNRDDELWNQDVVEIYLDANADGKDYVELQVSPANVVFDALFRSHRTPDWKEAKAYTLEGLKTAVNVRGTLNNSSDVDEGYDVEVAIPFASIPGFAPVPPKEDTWIRVNFFRMDSKDGKVVGAQAFSPAGGDFHDLNKAGRLEFVQGAAGTSSQVSTTTGPTRLGVDPAILKASSPRTKNLEVGREMSTTAK